MPQIGSPAPAVTGLVGDGSEVSLSDFHGMKNIVLYFYPKDSTPGCTIESNSFNAEAAEFSQHDTLIFGVSPDSVKSHQKFMTSQGLDAIQLLSDENKNICEDYGTWVNKSMYGRSYMGVQRSTFLIDKLGKIIAVWPNVKVAGHAEEVLRVVESL